MAGFKSAAADEIRSYENRLANHPVTQIEIIRSDWILIGLWWGIN